MNLLRPLALCITILSLIAATGIGHAQSSSTPEDVASRYIAAISSNDWEAASLLMHPEALDNLKRVFSDIASIDSSNMFLEIFFDEGTTPSTFERMSPHAVFSRFMSSLMSLRPEIGEAMGNASGTVIGHVDEEKDITHVVYRLHTGVSGATVRKVAVISMKRHGDTWLLLLSGDIENMAEAMRQAARDQQLDSGKEDHPDYDESEFDTIPPPQDE